MPLADRYVKSETPFRTNFIALAQWFCVKTTLKLTFIGLLRKLGNTHRPHIARTLFGKVARCM